MRGVGVMRDIWPGQIKLSGFHTVLVLGTLIGQGEKITRAMYMWVQNKRAIEWTKSGLKTRRYTCGTQGHITNNSGINIQKTE